ncbi:Glycosyltransferase 61 [Gracilaria domingensis]|nr:Glycosyltransferase 61 [Gracilaria domingensis]
MRLTKHRSLKGSSSHHLKYRRCILGSSQLENALRFASIFIIVGAFVEFSGLSEYVSDSYSVDESRGAIAHQATSGADAFPIPDIRRAGFSSVTKVQTETDNQRRMQKNRERLRFLYKNSDPQTPLADYLKTHKPKRRPKEKPSFMLEMYWNDDNFEDKVCRIHNACLKRDGSVLLHPWMKSQKYHLRECGVLKVAYMKSEKDFDQENEVNAGMDIYGIHPTRYHIPHFLTDILPMIYASEVLRPSTSEMKVRSVCEAPKKRRCEKRVHKDPLYAGFFTADRTGDLPLSGWVPQLAAMLPGRPTARFPKEMFNGTDKACFRSVIAYAMGSHVRTGRHWFGSSKMFDDHGLTRASVLRNETGRCEIQITILNRFGWQSRAGFLVGRDIVNVGAVTDGIEKLSKEEKYKNLELKVAVEYFENKSFEEQIDIMQKADVILGVHGAGLGNLVFARQDTPFIEVQPFTYYAGPFDSVSAALYLSYSRIVAEPDSKNFFECIEQKARRLGDDSIIHKAKELWNEAVKRRKDSGDLNYLLCHRFHQPSLAPMKLCSRSQRMKINVHETAIKLLDAAQEVCGRRDEGSG